MTDGSVCKEYGNGRALESNPVGFPGFQIGVQLLGIHGRYGLGKLIDGVEAHVFGFAVFALQLT